MLKVSKIQRNKWVVPKKLLLFFYFVYKQASKGWQDFAARNEGTEDETSKISLTPSNFSVSKYLIKQRFKCSEEDYLVAIDNLMRLRCLRSEIEEEYVSAVDQFGEEQSFDVYRDQGYWSLCITPLGREFVEACGQPTNQSSTGAKEMRPERQQK